MFTRIVQRSNATHAEVACLMLEPNKLNQLSMLLNGVSFVSSVDTYDKGSVEKLLDEHMSRLSNGLWITVPDGTNDFVLVSGHYSSTLIIGPESIVKLWEEKIAVIAGTRPEKVGTIINMIAKDREEGLYLRELATINAPVERGNYTPAAMESFDLIVKSFSSPAPRGRIAILDGPPGVGKSWYVRGLVTALPKAMFVIVTAKTVQVLADPEFIPMLVSKRDDDQPIVLIIEDADELLAKRVAKNMQGVSAILNMGDGLFGDALNFRVIATTNQPFAELDEAVVRTNRLCAHVQMGLLSHSQAQQVLRRLGCQSRLRDGAVSLSDVYSLATEGK